jgi:hypothetical protein
MTIADKATFAVLFSVDLGNTRESDRLVLMNRFLQGGLGPGITILHQAVFPFYSRCGFLLVAEAPSQDLVDKAISSCAGVFHTTVLPVVINKSDPAVLDAVYGLFAIDTQYKGLTPGYTAIQPDWVRVGLQLTLPAGFWCTAIWLVAAPSFRAAASFPAHTGVNGMIESAIATPLKDFFDSKMGRRPQPTLPPDPAPTAAPAAQPWTIYDEGPVAAYVDSDLSMPFTRDRSLQNIATQQQATVANSFAYLWKSLQADFPYLIIWAVYGGSTLRHASASLPAASWTYPDMVLTRAPGAPVGFDLGTLEAHPRTTLYLWLKDLMSPGSFHKPWPDESYDPGHTAAYNYILSQIPGKTPPKDGTIKEPTVISKIPYPSNATFTLQQFNDVQKDLLIEIDHFTTVDRWFGPSGIVNATTQKIALVSTNDLTEAVQLMTLPSDLTGITLFLDNIFNILSRIIGIIPVVGSAFSALIAIGWSIAKLAMTGGPGIPVNVPIAGMADKLNQYLEAMADSAQMQLKILYKDFGKLEEFSKGVILKTISPDQFYPGGATPADAADDQGPAQLPQEFLQAAANAWLLIIYQYLFAYIHTVKISLEVVPDVPNNPWNPDQGQYQFVWSVPCRSKDPKNNVADGYLTFGSGTDASTLVLQQLFGSNSRLNVNPIEFFAGLNGWPRALPEYYGPDGSPLPVVSLGLWQAP